MTTQGEILDYIKNRKKNMDYDELHKHFGSAKTNIRKQCKKLNRFGLIEIIIDNHKHIIMAGDVPRPLIKDKINKQR